ncbi:hypothetical protein NL287_28050, partial [Klebsiella pneumoniae]|nr:hypothetical protein [Klebsiella pneumoniae]
MLAGTERVLERDSSGYIFTGKFYKDMVSLGDGCSLILRNPRSENSGHYTVTVNVAREGSDKAGVQLIVKPPENTTG